MANRSNLSTTKDQRTISENRLSSKQIQTGDRISNLPNELLLHILSLLPTEDTIVTSVLSKRWSSLWKQMEDLRFDDENHYKFRFGEYVLQALFSYGNKHVKSVTISASLECEPFDLSSWIQMAFLQNVPKLVIRLNNILIPVTISPQVLQRINRLKILKLMGNININLSNNFANFGCLAELHLYNVKFEDEFSVSHLFSGCTKLQVLVVELFISSGVQNFVINVPTVRRLILGSWNCEEESIVVTAPLLEYLNIRGLQGVQQCVFDNTQNVKDATISYIEESMDGNLLDITISAQRLSITSTIMYPAGTVFHNLVDLEIDTRSDKWCQLLVFMLTSSPKLQILKVTGGMYSRETAQWNSPNNVARCLMLHLITVEWYDFNWRGEDDIAVAKYLVENGSTLENVAVKTYVLIDEEQEAERKVALAEIETVDKASPLCHLVFPELSYAKYEGKDDQDPDAREFMN